MTGSLSHPNWIPKAMPLAGVGSAHKIGPIREIFNFAHAVRRLGGDSRKHGPIRKIFDFASNRVSGSGGEATKIALN